MKQFFKPKTWLLTYLMITLAVAVSVVIISFQFNNDLKKVFASSADHNVSGWAWSENFGWISFNSSNCDADGNGQSDGAPAGCPPSGTLIPNYGVKIDEISGDFSGFAWSPNIGWIDFAPVGPPSAPNYSAKLDFNDKSVTGWAKILSLGDDGWLKMETVSISEAGDFSGWAWNGDGSVGLGWLSFNGSDAGAGGNYKVMTTADLSNINLGINSVVPTPGLKCSSLTINFTYTPDDPSYFKIFRNTVEIPGALSGLQRTYADSGLSPNTSYAYIVKAYDESNNELAESNEMSGTTFAVCATSDVIAVGVCPSSVNLSWTDTGADSYKIERCNQTENDCLLDSSFSEISSGSCNRPAITSCTDDTIEAAKAGNRYVYKVISMVGGEEGDGALSDPVIPCSSKPTWEEVKPR